MSNELFNTKKSESDTIKCTVVGYGKNYRCVLRPQIAQGSGTQETFEAGTCEPGNPLRGVGFTGFKYPIGSTVECRRDGQQGFSIVGSVSNALEKGDEADHIYPSSIPPFASAGIRQKFEKSLCEMWKGRTPFQNLDKKAAEVFNAELKKIGTEFGPKFTGGDPIKDNESRVWSVLKQQQTGNYAAVAKSLNKSIGDFAFTKGDMKDPVKYMQKVLGKKAELIPNAFSMIQNLKNAAKSGAPLSAANAVGGLEQIQQALAGIARIVSEQANNEDSLLEYLCKLYEELFPELKCKDAAGELTDAFHAWRKEYMRNLTKSQNEEVS